MLRSILGRSLRVSVPKRAESEAVGAWGEIYGPEHLQMQDSLRKIIEQDINPNVPEWEKAGQYPGKNQQDDLRYLTFSSP